ncbi:MAG: hypothetical protein V1701_07135 [Planctomycetota bacterium]
MNNQQSTKYNDALTTSPQRPKRWRWVFLCLCFFICGLFLGPILAQTIMWHYGPRPGPEDLDERVDHIVSQMRDDIGLTEEQTKQIYVITKEKLVALEDALRKNFDDMDLEIRAVLTDKQIVKFDEWRNKRLEKLPGPPRENMRRGEFPGPPIENIRRGNK